MDINNLQKSWDNFGKTDPLWAILAWPAKKDNKWKADEFFETGVREIDSVMKYIRSLEINIPGKKALDFGCGVGRLTQALMIYFDEAFGVDIAPSMIELAKKYNRYGDRCKYYLNESEELNLFQDNDFDFIYSNITLQHMEPRYSKKYLIELIRILAPGGLLIFQLPSEKKEHQTSNLKESLKNIVPSGLLTLSRKLRFGAQTEMEMYGIPKNEVAGFLGECGAKLIDAVEDQWAGKEWISFRYCVMKMGSYNKAL